MDRLRAVEELDGPPIVGEDYLVLSIEVAGHDVPVLGSYHADRNDPKFEHYHLDRRFLPEHLFCMYGRFNPYDPSWDRTVQTSVFGVRISRVGARYRRFTCLRDLPRWQGKAMVWLSPTDTCAKAQWKQGKPYCPHQGLELAQFWDGKAGTIRCPMHGLLVDMRKD